MGYQFRGEIECAKCGRRPAVARRLCRSCYNTARFAGRLGKYKVLGPDDVFERRIKKTDGCWLWTGMKNGYGYGIFLLRGEKQVRAHRYSYEHFVGKIPAGKIILHTCDNPQCVNPKHLRVGTKDDNNKDTAIKRRHNYGTAHWNGRLTSKDVLKIRASKETHRVLSERFGVSQSHISRIKSGKNRRVI